MFVIKSARELLSLYQIVLVLFSLILSCKRFDSPGLSIPGLQSDEIFVLYIPRARLCRKSLYIKGNNPIPIEVTSRTNGTLPQTVLKLLERTLQRHILLESGKIHKNKQQVGICLN